LDIAHRLGVLGLMAPPPNLDGGYVATLFSGAQPSTVSFSEQSAFRHYLHALRAQVRLIDQTSLNSAVQQYQGALNDAENVLQHLRAANISGQLRDFRDIVDVNRAALGLFTALRGPMLRRQWDAI